MTNNRGNVTTTDFKKFGISFEDNDGVPLKYIRDEVVPEIMDKHGNKIPVPVQYIQGERWQQIKNTGVAYDTSGANKTILKPLIALSRTGFGINKTLSRKLSIQDPLTMTYVRQWDKSNRYDNFAALHDAKPVYNLENIVVPTYINLEYEVGIWTDYIEQMNRIAEALIYTEGTYWFSGDHQFYVSFDNFSSETVVVGDDARVVRGSLTLSMIGFIIPDTVANEKHVQTQGNTIRRVVMTETVVNYEQ